MNKKNTLTIEEWIVGVTMVIMFAVTTINVFGRYIFNSSLAFLDEATTYVFIFTIFFGTSAACLRGENLGMDSLVVRLPVSVQKAFVVYVTVFSVALYIILCWQGVIMTKTHMINKLVTASSGIPNWIFSIVVPISAVFYIVRCIQYGLETIKKLDTDKANESTEVKGGEN